MNEVTNDYTRAPYIKPKLERVELVAEEAVLATCKYNNGAQSGMDYTCMPDLDCVVTQRS